MTKKQINKHDLSKGRNRRYAYVQGKDDTKRRLHVSWWYRGDESEIIASTTNLKEKNGLEHYVAKGWLPKAPVLTSDMQILVMGSCFAESIAKFIKHKSHIATIPKPDRTRVSHRFSHTTGGLDLRGNVNLFVYGAGYQTTFSVLHQLEWALGERDIDISHMYNPKGYELLADPPYGKDTQPVAHRALMDSDAFILNFNTAEVWYDKKKRYTCFGAVPRGCLNEERLASTPVL